MTDCEEANRGWKMVDMAALKRGLPASGLEPECVGLVEGIANVSGRTWGGDIKLLEPPAGELTPYIDPIETLRILLLGLGCSSAEARSRADESFPRMRAEIPDPLWINFFDSVQPDSSECLSVPQFTYWLRENAGRLHQEGAAECCSTGIGILAGRDLLVLSDMLDFIDEAALICTSATMFKTFLKPSEHWSIEYMATNPLSHTLIETMPGGPWIFFDDKEKIHTGDNALRRWRDAVRPVAAELEKVLGKPVYYFADPTQPHDDDDAHRFLILHWCCSYKPRSAFVRYLVRVSGAENVETLKAALIDPKNYTEAFELGDARYAPAAHCCRFSYVRPIGK